MKLYGSQAGWYYFINDHLGTPQKIVDSSSQIVWAGFYQPFGKAWAYPADITNNFRFPGQYYDAETGLHYNWHRYYDPDTGRYLTSDPIGLEGGINLYVYVRGNPINWADIFGLMEDAIRNPPDILNRMLNNLSTRIHQFVHPEQWGPNQGVENFMFIADAISLVLSFGVERVAGCVVPKITQKGIQLIEKHLGKLDALDDPLNKEMLRRLKAGEISSSELKFYEHEIIESGIIKDYSYEGARKAHLETLKLQGIEYKKGYEKILYGEELYEKYLK